MSAFAQTHCGAEENLFKFLTQQHGSNGKPSKGIVATPSMETISAVVEACRGWGSVVTLARQPSLFSHESGGIGRIQGMEVQEIDRACKWAGAIATRGQECPVFILVAPTMQCIQRLRTQTAGTRVVMIALEVLAAEDTDTTMATVMKMHSLYSASIRKEIQAVITSAPCYSDVFGGYGSREATIIFVDLGEARAARYQRVLVARDERDMAPTRILVEATAGVAQKGSGVMSAVESRLGRFEYGGQARSVFPKGAAIAARAHVVDISGQAVTVAEVQAACLDNRPKGVPDGQHVAVWVDGEEGEWITCAHGRDHGEAAELLALYDEQCPTLWKLSREGTFSVAATPAEWHALQKIATDAQHPLEMGGRSGTMAYQLTRAPGSDTQYHRLFDVTMMPPGRDDRICYQVEGAHLMATADTNAQIRKQLTAHGLPGSGPLRSAQVRTPLGAPMWVIAFDVSEIRQPTLVDTLDKMIRGGSTVPINGKEYKLAHLGIEMQQTQWKPFAPRKLIEIEKEAHEQRTRLHRRNRHQDLPNIRWPFVSSLYDTRQNEEVVPVDAIILPARNQGELACCGISILGYKGNKGDESDNVRIYGLPTGIIPLTDSIMPLMAFTRPSDIARFEAGLVRCDEDSQLQLNLLIAKRPDARGIWYELRVDELARIRGMVCNLLTTVGDGCCTIIFAQGARVVMDAWHDQDERLKANPQVPTHHRYGAGAVKITTVSEGMISVTKETALQRKLAIVSDSGGWSDMPKLQICLPYGRPPYGEGMRSPLAAHLSKHPNVYEAAGVEAAEKQDVGGNGAAVDLDSTPPPDWGAGDHARKAARAMQNLHLSQLSGISHAKSAARGLGEAHGSASSQATEQGSAAAAAAVPAPATPPGAVGMELDSENLAADHEMEARAEKPEPPTMGASVAVANQGIEALRALGASSQRRTNERDARAAEDERKTKALRHGDEKRSKALKKAGDAAAAADLLAGGDPETAAWRSWLQGIEADTRPVCLISGFDGTHTARLAVEAHISRRISMAVVMESDMRERLIVAEKFGYSVRAKGWNVTSDGVLLLNLPDVWDLVRHNALRLAQAIAIMPIGTLVISMWGSPCQDLTSFAEGTNGELGFVGTRSVHMHVAYLVHWLLMTCGRADLVISTNLENAGSMKPQMLAYIRAVFARDDFGTRLSAGAYSVSARNRFFFSEFAIGPPPKRDPLPWDEGWNCLPHLREGRFPPWLKSRGVTKAGIVLFSTMMYHPNNLLYSDQALKARTRPDAPRSQPEGRSRLAHLDDADGTPEEEWESTTAEQRKQLGDSGASGFHEEVPALEWMELIPARFHDAVRLLFAWDPRNSQKMCRKEEDCLTDYKEWVEIQDGKTTGFRTPRPHERLKDCGIEGFFHGTTLLGNMARVAVVADMTGNLFKQPSWWQRWGEGRAAGTGLRLRDVADEKPGDPTRMERRMPAAPGEVTKMYQALLQEKTLAFPGFVPKMAGHPFPVDILPFIAALGSGDFSWISQGSGRPKVTAIQLQPREEVEEALKTVMSHTGGIAQGVLPQYLGGASGQSPEDAGAIMVGGGTEPGGPWWATWGQGRIEDFLSLNRDRNRRTAAFALAITGTMPTDEPEYDEGLCLQTAVGHERRRDKTYFDGNWVGKVDSLATALKHPKYGMHLKDGKTSSDIPRLLMALDILTEGRGPEAGVLVSVAKKRVNFNTYNISKETLMFITQPRNAAHLLLISGPGMILGIARQGTGGSRGPDGVAQHGQPGAIEAVRAQPEIHTWGPQLDGTLATPKDSAAWHAWAAARTFKFGPHNGSAASRPLAIAAAMLTAILNIATYHPGHADLAAFTSAEYLQASGDDKSPAAVATSLLAAWGLDINKMPPAVAGLLHSGVCVAILTAESQCRSGVAITLLPRRNPSALLLPSPPPSPPPSDRIALLLSFGGAQFVPLVRFPWWSVTTAAQQGYDSLTKAVLAQSLGSAVAVPLDLTSEHWMAIEPA